MQVKGYSEYLEIVLFPTETELLRGILYDIDKAYAIPADQLESNVRTVWYSGEGFRSVEMSPEDIKEWNESLQEFRGQNRTYCQEWIALLLEGGDPLVWRVTRAEADTLLTVLNDYRLYQAARHEIGEEEMDQDFSAIKSVSMRMALLEIHFLAWLMEMVLQALSSPPEDS